MMLSNELFSYIQGCLPELKLLENQPLSAYTSFRIGGPGLIAFPASVGELISLCELCRSAQIPVRFLGAGTNILAPDCGVEGLVICTKGLTEVENLGGGKLRAQCGVTMTKLACAARDLGLTGLEFAHGIPGTVGGGVYMNAGAYGGEIKQVAVTTTALLPDGTLWKAEGAQQGFGYRHSAFMERGALVLETEFQLCPGDREAIDRTMKELAEKRRASQPLEFPSAGSTFKRPVGGFAAALIDQAGLKGYGVGGAQVSEKHAGFVINKGNATAEDVKTLMQDISEKVFTCSGIRLEPEVRIW